jgi:hypothetical protein
MSRHQSPAETALTAAIGNDSALCKIRDLDVWLVSGSIQPAAISNSWHQCGRGKLSPNCFATSHEDIQNADD